MSDTDLSLAEQLSALMDGELPEAQARFLRRRLEHDAELRAQWSRMQLASSCLRAHPVQPMALDCAAIRDEQQAAATGLRRPAMRWAVAASVAALALALAPRFLSDANAPAATPIAASQPALVPSPAAADLVAMRPMQTRPTPMIQASAPVSVGSSPVLIASAPVSRAASPLPLDSQSPADFPLVDTGEKRWPRSALVSAGNDPALEAYLVRHNQMLANDGLSGFVPYVDVVASSPAASDVASGNADAQEPDSQ